MQIHWHEGLFLLPHHFQLLQRNFTSSLSKERKLFLPYSYGFLLADLLEDELENFRISFRRLLAIFPSGRFISYPDDAELPSRSFQNELQQSTEITVSIAVPFWKENYPNCTTTSTSQNDSKILYRLTERTHFDENTGENPRPIIQRLTSARILFKGEDESDLETLPILHITRDAGEKLGRPRLDSSFSGPCLLLLASPSLLQCFQSLLNQIEAARQQLQILISRGGFTFQSLRPTQLEQLLRLQALNRSLVTLRLLSNTQNLHPFSAFLALHQLASDLCSLQPDSPFPLPIPYNHDQPHLSFLQLSDLLRQLLRSSSQPSYIKIPFILAENFLKATLPLETPYQNADFFLGIHTSDDPIEVARLVQNEDRFKLTPPSLANRAVRGILLQEERFPPYQLPIETSLLFFRLRISESQEIWARVEKENALTARWSGYEKGNLELALYIVPKKSS